MIYIVRHGQTDWNYEKRIQGSKNIKLNETGKKQAEELRNLISNINYDVIYSSDLDRAIETANIINIKEKEIITDKRLREVNYGEIEGKTHRELTDEIWYIYNHNPKEINAESKEECYYRIKAFIDELDQSKDILLVTHGGTIKLLIYYLENQNIGFNKELFDTEYQPFKISNADVLSYGQSKIKRIR